MTNPQPETPNIAEELQRSFDDGVKQGHKEMANDLLKWLEHKYISDPKRPRRGTPEAKALLKLAKEAAQYLRKRKKL